MKSADEMTAEQSAFWNGPGGENWLAGAGWRERSWEPLTRLLMEAAAARTAERIIDVGCGAGTTTVDLAQAVGSGGHVLGIDISDTLIRAGRSQCAGNCELVVGDAATHSFLLQAYDMVFSRFGVMFFGDPLAAFRNFHRALKRGGRLVFICWRPARENQSSFVLGQAAAPFLPLPVLPRPGPDEPGLYSFGDRARVERILQESGFDRPEFQPVDRPQWMAATAEEVLASLMRFGPYARAFSTADPVSVENAKAAVRVALEPFQRPDGVFFPAACWLVRAHKD